MSTKGPITTALVLVLAAILLLWPAFWNGYPLVFADTGTYLSQAIEHYAGWDRPIFYRLRTSANRRHETTLIAEIADPALIFLGHYPTSNNIGRHE
jgi:hypothetical protein